MSRISDMRSGYLGRVANQVRRLWRLWWPPRANVSALYPIDQLEPIAGAKDNWRATGNDPKFECVIDQPPLKAGWYRFSAALEKVEGDELEPTLYFDYGDGMREEWSVYLNFYHAAADRHGGVVLVPHDVHRLRFDPANARCSFCLQDLTMVRIGRLEATRAMWRAVAKMHLAAGGHTGELWRSAWSRLRRPGGRREFARWLHDLYVKPDNRRTTYERWLRLYDGSERTTSGSERATTGCTGPLISILMPTFNTPETWLRRCLDSVLVQSCPNWELCIADDASDEGPVRRVLQEYSRRDPRIRITWRERNGHISEASNSALAMARGDYVALLDHDDELHPQAVASIVEAVQRHPRWQMIYSDEDKIDERGRRHEPYFKPDWNPDLLCGHNCVSHLGVYSRELLNSLGGFRAGLEGSQDWDLALRCSEQLQTDQVGHIPRILYHWRAIQGSTAQGVGQKRYAHDAGRRAIVEHLARRGIAADVCDIEGVLGMFRVRHRLTEPAPRVSIIVPTRDRIDLLRRCVESILATTIYPDYEIVVVDNQSVEPASIAYLNDISEDARVRVLAHDQPFNYSTINNAAVRNCSSELVCLLNNDTEVVSPCWLEELASQAMRPHVGAVGAMLYYPDDTIQHAGVVTGIHGVAAHPYCGKPRGFPGQMSRGRLVQNMSAVTAACLMVRRATYLQVGGLDVSLTVAFNDIDFCLRLRRAGFSNVWTPFAELYHHESASRGSEDTPEKRVRFTGEVEFMKHRWGSELDYDPAYNPNLTLSGEPFTLAFPPREWPQPQIDLPFHKEVQSRRGVRTS